MGISTMFLNQHKLVKSAMSKPDCSLFFVKTSLNDMLGKVDLFVEVGLVEPPLSVLAVHQQPPLFGQEIGNHLV